MLSKWCECQRWYKSVLAAKLRFVPAKIWHGYNQSKDNLRWWFTGTWSLPFGSAHLSLNAAVVTKHCGCSQKDCIRLKVGGITVISPANGFFPLFWSNATHPNSLSWDGEDEAEKLSAKQHRCPIFLSFQAKPPIFHKVPVFTGEMYWFLCFGKGLLGN